MDQEISKISERFYREVRNKTIAEVYNNLGDMISQKDYAIRVKVDKAKLCRLLSKYPSK